MREGRSCRKWYKARGGTKKNNFTKMAGAESNIEFEGEAVRRPLVQLVLHDKDNKTEVGLLAEDR
jgi:hypothetical protein